MQNRKFGWGFSHELLKEVEDHACESGMNFSQAAGLLCEKGLGATKASLLRSE